MQISNLKRWRMGALLLCAAAIAATIVAMPRGNPLLFASSALLAFSSLGFFVFTEAFLLPPPQRAKTDIWMARVFLVPIVFVVLGLAFALLTGEL